LGIYLILLNNKTLTTIIIKLNLIQTINFTSLQKGFLLTNLFYYIESQFQVIIKLLLDDLVLKLVFGKTHKHICISQKEYKMCNGTPKQIFFLQITTLNLM